MQTRIVILYVVTAIALAASAGCASAPAVLATPTATVPPTATVLPTSVPDPTETYVVRSTLVPESKLQIVTDEYDPEKLPSIDWDYATSEQFLLDLMQADKEGKIPHPSEKAYYIQPGMISPQFADGSPSALKEIDKDKIFAIIGLHHFARPENRPWTSAGIWKTQLGDIEIVFFVERWENADGSAGYLGYFYPREMEKNVEWGLKQSGIVLDSSDPQKAAAIWWLTANTDKNSPNVQLGRFYNSKDSFISNNSMSADQSLVPLADWYFQHFDQILPKEIYNRWRDTGILSNTISIQGIDRTILILPLAGPFPHVISGG